MFLGRKTGFISFLDENGPMVSEESEAEIVQRLERSVDNWVSDRQDYPPALRGAVANLSDFRTKLAALISAIGADSENPDSALKQVLWFDSINSKLEDACAEAKNAFLPHAVNSDGLISWNDKDNPVLAQPTRHRMMVSEQFAATNYKKRSADAELIADDDDSAEIAPIKPNSWKRKITQSLSPWKIKVDNKIVAARKPDEMQLALNAILNRTKHGWLVADLKKLKKRRGSILVYARTLEYPKVGEQRFEFMLQLFGTPRELNKRMGKTLKRTACLHVDTDDQGNAFLVKATTYPKGFEQSIPQAAKHIEIPLDVQTVDSDGQPSQLKLVPGGKYFDAKIAPLLEKKQAMATRFDLRKSNSNEKTYSFRLNVKLQRPLLISSASDSLFFQYDNILKRLCRTDLATLKAKQSQSRG